MTGLFPDRQTSGFVPRATRFMNELIKHIPQSNMILSLKNGKDKGWGRM